MENQRLIDHPNVEHRIGALNQEYEQDLHGVSD
jgi:hypothetical protein